MAQAAIIDKCDLCESEDQVDYFCVNCQEILCKSCKLTHSKSKKTKKDQIIILSQARHDDLVHKSITVYCSEHPTVEITLFCLQCDKLICTQCLADEHNGHNISSLDKIRDSKTEKLQKLLKTLKEKKTIYENAFDIQGQAHSRFLKSIDKVEKEILDQKAKIIEELDIVCKEQFLVLKEAMRNEEKKYSNICNEIQAQNQAITSAIQSAQSSIDSNNTALIVQSTAETTNTLQGLEDPTTPPTTVATYQPGDRSHPTICHIQGKVNIQQKTATYQHGDHPNIPPVLGKVNTELGTKPKPMTDVQKVKLQKQKISGGNKQQPGVNKPRIDVDKVRVRSTVKVKDKGTVECIVPMKNKTAWVKFDDDDEHLTLIDRAGKIITKSVSLNSQIYDVKLYRNGLLVTCWFQCTIIMMSAKGKSPSTFSDLAPYEAQGLCVTQDQDVIVHLYISSTDNKVVRLNTAGHITQTIQQDFSDPSSVTSLTTGEVIVVDSGMIVGVDREGGHLFTWKGEIQGRKLGDYGVSCMTHDSNNNVFVTDYRNDRVYVLGKDGSGGMCLLDSTLGIEKPLGISVDNTGKLWVGCRGGNIHIIEY